MNTPNRKLRVFLCHASQDKPIVRELYQRLNAEGWIDPWLDEEKLLPGHKWEIEIEKAVETADAVIVCLSSNSVTKEGFVQRELKFVLDITDEKPEGAIFLIPIRINECEVPRRIRREFQYGDFFPIAQVNRAYKKLFTALEQRANIKGINVQELKDKAKRRAEEKQIEEKIRSEFEEKERIKKEALARKRYEKKLRLAAEKRAERQREKRAQKKAEKQAEEIARLNVLKDANQDREIRLKEDKANQLELIGDISGALALFYELRNISTSNLRVNEKIIELERESRIQEEASKSKAIKTLSSEFLVFQIPTHKEHNGYQLFYIGKVGYIKIPPGKFLTGDDGIENAKPQHEVNIPYDFLIMQGGVTNYQYTEFLKAKKVFDYGRPHGRWPLEQNVTLVSWSEVQRYISLVNEEFQNNIPDGYVVRLPTEAEWEKSEKLGIENSKVFTSGSLLFVRAGQEWTCSIYKKYPYVVSSLNQTNDIGYKGEIVMRGGRKEFAMRDPIPASKRFHPDYDRGKGAFRMVVAPEIFS